MKEALKSVAAQTLPPSRIIIIDNSPTGDAKVLVEEMSIDIEYVKSEPNQGLAYYFNQCLETAKNDWCTILHSDDRLLPDYIETITKAYSNTFNIVGIFTKTIAINESGNKCFSLKDWGKQYFWPECGRRKLINGEKALAAMLRVNYIMCPTMCYNLAALKNRRFDPQWKSLLDMDFHGRLLLEGESFLGINKPLYACRRHPNATTTLHERDFSMFLEGKKCIKSLAKRAADIGWSSAAATGNRMVIYNLFVLAIVLRRLRLNNISNTFKFLRNYTKS